MLPDERLKLLEAVEAILDSQALYEEFENANYHGAWYFLGEIRNSLEDGDPIGDDEWNENED